MALSHALLGMSYMTRGGYLVVLLLRAGHTVLENASYFNRNLKMSHRYALYFLLSNIFLLLQSCF